MPLNRNGISLSFDFARQTLGSGRGAPDEESFHRMISMERKRTARSRKPFLLMLLDTNTGVPRHQSVSVLAEVLSALSLSTRETDVTGWYKDGSVVGVMFTEIGIADHNSIARTMLARVNDTLRSLLPLEQFNQINISFHLFPEQRDHETPTRPSNPVLYPDLVRRENARNSFRAMKRVMDIVGSLVALTFCAPLFLIIAAAIKLNSKGPVFFRQVRVGQYGAPFVFLKFRSMYTDSDHDVHGAMFGS